MEETLSDALGNLIKDVQNGYKANKADELDAAPFEDTDGEKKESNEQEKKLTKQKPEPKDVVALTKVPDDNVIMKQ